MENSEYITIGTVTIHTTTLPNGRGIVYAHDTATNRTIGRFVQSHAGATQAVQKLADQAAAIAA